MKPLSIHRITPSLLLPFFATLIALLLPGGHAQAQQAQTATPTATPAVPGNFAGKATDNGIVLSWTALGGGVANYGKKKGQACHTSPGSKSLSAIL